MDTSMQESLIQSVMMTNQHLLEQNQLLIQTLREMKQQTSVSWDKLPETYEPDEPEDVGITFDPIKMTEYDIDQEIEAAVNEDRETEATLNAELEAAFPYE